MALGPTIVRKEQVNPLAAAGEGFMRFQIEKGQREIAMAQKQEDARFQNALLTERATQLAGVEDQIATERMVKQFVLQRQLGKDAYQDELATKRAAAKQLHALQQINTKAEFAIADIRADEFKPEQATAMVASILDRTPLSGVPEYADILQDIDAQNQDPANSLRLLKRLSLLGMQVQKPKQQQPGLVDELAQVAQGLAYAVEQGWMTEEEAKAHARAGVEKQVTGTVERPGQQGAANWRYENNVQEYWMIQQSIEGREGLTLKAAKKEYDEVFGTSGDVADKVRVDPEGTWGDDTWKQASPEEIAGVIQALQQGLGRAPTEDEVEAALNERGFTGMY